MGQRHGQGGNLAAQQRYSQQQMYQQHRNQVGSAGGQDQALNSKIAENQARAAQLSEQINRQKSQLQQPQKKVARANANNAAGSGQPAARNQRQRAKWIPT